MCKLLIVINGGNAKGCKELIKAQFDVLSLENDGAGALAIHKDGSIETCRSLTDYEKVYKFALDAVKTSKLIALHTRTGTSGIRNEDNVHFFQHDKRYFAHNGFVAEYHDFTNWQYSSIGFKPTTVIVQESLTTYDTASEKMANCKGCESAKAGYCKRHVSEAESVGLIETSSFNNPDIDLLTTNKTSSSMCDSFQFLENLPKDIDKEILAREAKTKSFTGASLLVDANSIYFMAYKDCQILTDKNITAISSYPLVREKTESISGTSYGISYKNAKLKTKLAGAIHKVAQGVHEITLK